MRKLKADNVPPVLVLAVCAISARFSTHPQVDTEPAFLRGDMWATPARVIVGRRHGGPNITVLIIMIILGLHSFGTCEGGLSWSFGGQAIRMAFALEPHRELEHNPLGPKERQIFRVELYRLGNSKTDDVAELFDRQIQRLRLREASVWK